MGLEPAAAQAGDLTMPWSVEQAGMLEAMGFSPLVLPGAVRAAPAANAASDRLALALHRAARGRDLAGLGADLEALRRDPRAKRMLWPQLRALRRRG